MFGLRGLRFRVESRGPALNLAIVTALQEARDELVELREESSR